MFTYWTIALCACIPLVSVEELCKRRGKKFGAWKTVRKMHWNKCWPNIIVRLCTWQKFYTGQIYILKYLLLKGHAVQGCCPWQRGSMYFHKRDWLGQLLQNYLQNNNIQFKRLKKFLLYLLLMLHSDINIQVGVSSIEHCSGLWSFYFNFYLKNRTTDIITFSPFFQLLI